ncbi:sterol desaturase family protein [Halobacteriovorax sp. GB3]|uniref:sterol desaturase family protein n=1 Tax=Halobacteriovorax sp. GB3 TaxID=2719615 RepID=UPI00235FB84C|nr:sterol desaturase family protein [Halobacteriovorax sp. GB3]MDD0852276.1 sterol desaturase family protein [Halobacteriovorax sp. GB3]
MNELSLRPIIFLFTLALFFILEHIFKRREAIYFKKEKWHRVFSNLSLVFIGNFLVKHLLPFAPYGLALLVEQDKVWSLQLLGQIDSHVSFVIGLISLDFFIYFQHVLSHRVAFIWRIHRVHHADRELDSTSALRFHPLEIYGSSLYKMALIVLMGYSSTTIFWFEVILSSSAIFNHSNLYLPKKIDQVIRLFFVTPDFHRSHHCENRLRHDRNYGFCFSFWDYLFKTYESVDFKEQEQLKIGLKEFEKKEETLPLFNLLKMPFRK